jgi:hypothetical protein
MNNSCNIQIEICIPYIGMGIRFLEELLKNIDEMASGGRVIKSVSYHTEADLGILKSSPEFNRVDNVILAEVSDVSNSIPFSGSVKHSRAINCLLKKSVGDIIVIMDYDMRFVVKGWDLYLMEEVSDNKVLGLCYPDGACNDNMINSQTKERFGLNLGVPIFKYQNKPTMTFFAFNRKSFVTEFGVVLTKFDELILGGGSPFVEITEQEVQGILGIPRGCIWWRDTFFELPYALEDLNIKYKLLYRRPMLRFSIKRLLYKIIDRPYFDEEIIYDGSKRTLLTHVNKGSGKLKRIKIDKYIEKFNQYSVKLSWEYMNEKSN